MPPLDEGQAGAIVGLYLAVVELAVCYIDILEVILQLDDIAFLKRAVQVIVQKVPQCPDAVTLPGAFGRGREDETVVWVIFPASVFGFLVEAITSVEFYPDIARSS